MLEGERAWATLKDEAVAEVCPVLQNQKEHGLTSASDPIEGYDCDLPEESTIGEAMVGDKRFGGESDSEEAEVSPILHPSHTESHTIKSTRY